MPASTGAVGRAGSARAVHATASASGSRSTWSFTGCLLPVVMFASLACRGMSHLAGLVSPVRREPTCSWDSLSYKNVVVIGAVDAGENDVPPARSPFLMHRPCAAVVQASGPYVDSAEVFPRCPLVVPRFSTGCPLICPQVPSTGSG